MRYGIYSRLTFDGDFVEVFSHVAPILVIIVRDETKMKQRAFAIAEKSKFTTLIVKIVLHQEREYCKSETSFILLFIYTNLRKKVYLYKPYKKYYVKYCKIIKIIKYNYKIIKYCKNII